MLCAATAWPAVTAIAEMKLYRALQTEMGRCYHLPSHIALEQDRRTEQSTSGKSVPVIYVLVNLLNFASVSLKIAQVSLETTVLDSFWAAYSALPCCCTV